MSSSLGEVTTAESFPDLSRLFDARAIAVVGASSDPSKIGGRVLAFLTRHGYRGKIYPVNPSQAPTPGSTFVANVRAIDDVVDLAIVAVPAAAVPAVIEDCGVAQIPFAVVFSGGFGETGPAGRRLEERLIRVTREAGVRLCGPNTVGIVSEPRRIIATFASSMERHAKLLPGDAALVAQSGAVAAFIHSIGQENGIGLRHVIAVGNETDLQIADFVAFLAREQETRAIGVYVEGFKDGRRFLEAADVARRAGKPVCVLKTGRSEQGGRAVQSHTGVLAGSDRVYDGAFAQAGIVRASGLEDLMDFLGICGSGIPLPRKGHVGIISASGGLGAWAADRFAELDLELAQLSANTQRELRQVLPAFAAAANPVDLTGQVLTHPEMIGACVDAVLGDEDVAGALFIIGFQEEAGEAIASRLIQAQQTNGKPVVTAWLLAPERAHALLREAGVFTFESVERATVCLARYLEAGRQLMRKRSDLGSSGTSSRLILDTVPRNDHVVAEYHAKRILEPHFTVPSGALVTSSEEAVAAAQEIGFPVVLKAQGPTLAHKSNYGLVRVGVTDDRQVRNGYAAIVEAGRDLGLDGVLVEQMAPEGIEAIIGVVEDPTFGPTVAVGLGGTLVEAIESVAFRPAPVSEADADEMIAETLLEKLLGGVRGNGPYDRPALVRAICSASVLAWENRQVVAELEINPLIVHRAGEGATVADALIVLQPNSRPWRAP